MIAIQRDYADRGVRFVAFNSNDASRYPADSFEAMRSARRARASTSTTSTTRTSRSRARSASERTPEVFVFDRDRRLVYHGAIDDSRDERRVGRAATSATPSTPCSRRRPAESAETPPVGCTVKWRE